VERLVEAMVAIIARTTPIYEVVRRSAADPDVSGLLEETRRRRRRDQGELTEVLWRSGHLHFHAAYSKRGSPRQLRPGQVRPPSAAGRRRSARRHHEGQGVEHADHDQQEPIPGDQ
jgi:hypothetical protein